MAKKKVKPTHHLELHRFIHNHESTTGVLMIDDVFFCFTLEDQAQEMKIAGETRIGAGNYPVTLNKNVTPLTQKYRTKFGWFDYHIQINDVPNFSWIYFHIGNTDRDSSGCVLLGEVASKNGTIGRSTQAFTEFYKMVHEWLSDGHTVNLTIH